MTDITVTVEESVPHTTEVSSNSSVVVSAASSQTVEVDNTPIEINIDASPTVIEVGGGGGSGSPGPVGPQGAQGLPGVNGIDGLPGAIGPSGLQGIPGLDGAIGPSGLQGVQGIQGPIGPSGISADVSSFLVLNDTPNTYSGYAGQAVIVNPGESGLEFSGIHSPITILDTSSINLSLLGQQLSAEVIFGTTGDTVASGSHSHVDIDHAAVTLDTNADTILSLSTQQELGLDIQAAHAVLIGRVDAGVALVPTFRALAAIDIPVLALANLPSGTAQYQVLTTGATPFVPVYTGYLLDGTTGGKTVLAVTSAKTLTLTATDNFNLTVPATLTVAGLAIANVFTAVQSIDVASGVEGFKLLSGSTTKLSLKWVGSTLTLDVPSVEPSNQLLNPTFDTDLTSWSEVPSYVLNDQFTTDLAAGSVNGSQAEPTGGTRTGVDTNLKLSITGGKASFATGGAASGNPGLWYPSTTRIAGKILILNINLASGNAFYFGFDNNQAWGPGSNLFTTDGGGIYAQEGGTGYRIVAPLSTSGTEYKYALILRSFGAYFFIKGGTYTNWTLLWIDSITSSNHSPVYPMINGDTATVFTTDNIRIPTTTWLPTPLCYDTFTRDDGAIGNSEVGSPDGVAAYYAGALAWSNQVGAFTISTNKAVGSTLSGGIAIATVPTASANALIDVNIVRSAGDAGGIARYVDSSNYLKFYIEGTNAVCVKVVAGTPTTLRTAAVTYVSGATLRLVLESATSARLFYNNLAVGAVFTVPTSTSVNHGLYTSDTGNTFDNFTVFPRATTFASAPFEELTVSRDTGTKYAGAASVKLIAGGVDANYLQSVTLPDTAAYTFLCYAYTTGAAVTTADLNLFYDGAVLATTFTSVGGGWYRLTGSLTGVASAKDYGVRVKAGITVYCDSFSLQAGAGNTTTLEMLNSGTGNLQFNYEGRSTLNAGVATETAAVFKGFSGQTANIAEVQNSAGTVLSLFDKDGILTVPFINSIIDSAVTNAIVNAAMLRASSSGNVVDGFGTGLLFSGESATASTFKNLALFAGYYKTATAATFLGAARISVYDSYSPTTPRTGIEIEATGAGVTNKSFGGNINKTRRVTGATDTILAYDEVLYYDTDSNAIAAALPVGIEGTRYKIINCGSSGRNVTLTPNGSEKVYGAASEILYDGEVVDIHFNATEFWH